jgi:hypothetical protein
MRGKRIWMIALGLGALGVALPLVLAQQPSAGVLSAPPPVSAPAPATVKPVAHLQPASKLDPAKLSLLEREIYLAGQRGAEWLQRANRPDGRFVYGYLPALRTAMEGDHYLQQVEATWALARAARFYRDEKAGAIARQAMLTLLEETRLDRNSSEKAAGIRYPMMPSVLVNRLAAAGMLVLAIHELPAPASDLLEKSAELCNYLRTQQSSDGSLILDVDKTGPATVEVAAVSYYTGPALQALMRSGPAPWKTEAVRKAHGFYARWWREHKNMGMIPWHSAAYAEAYRATKEPAFADTVFEMNDWLCTLQYQQLESRRPLWQGGFKSWRDRRELAEAPEAGSALYAESLMHACATAREAGDVRRWQRYKDAAGLCLRFLTTLQYTDANTQHFSAWYRPALVGAFHASHQDGNMRLDYTSRSVAALVAYLEAQVAQQ